jgi:hypothetical protein
MKEWFERAATMNRQRRFRPAVGPDRPCDEIR